MTNANIFRKVSLERLSSPEQLDQRLRVTSLRAWLVLAAFLSLLAAVVVWGFWGTVVTTASGSGVIVRKGGVLNVVAPGTGVLTDLNVHPGMTVKANQVIAHVAQPALVQQLHALENAKDEVLHDRNVSLQLDVVTSRLKLAANDRQQANTDALIAEYQKRILILDQQLVVEQELLNKGLVTKQQVLDLQDKKAGINDQIAAARAQLRLLAADRLASEQLPQRTNLETQSRVSDVDRKIAVAKQMLELSEQVVSPFEGQVLELKLLPGSLVTEAEPIISLQPRREMLEVVAYIPSLRAKDIQLGMEVEVSPSNLKREQYGFLRGHVTYVADYPATPAGMMRNFENEALVRLMSENGAVTEIQAALERTPATPSGFVWSTSRGPDFTLTSGTLCSLEVVTKHQRPVTLLFPFMNANGDR